MKQICIIGTGYVGLGTGVCTEWNEFMQLDKGRMLESMRQPYLIDERNIYDRKEMERLGFVCWGLGHSMTPLSNQGQGSA